MRQQLVITEIAERAAGQHGVVSLDQLASAGLTTAQIRHRVTAGWLAKVTTRVFAIAGSPETHERRLQTGLLHLGEKSWVSYEAAAALHGLDRSDANAEEFTVPHARVIPSGPFIIHTTKFLDRLDTVRINGFRTMSATRTVIDLAHARSSFRRVAAAFDSAVRLGASHPHVLAARLTTLRGSGRWGCRLIDRLLPDGGGHSPLERSFLRLARELAIERPETQVVQRDATGRHVARVDFLFVKQGLVVEVNGRRGHVSDAERAKDAQRRNELQALGLRVVEYTTSHLRDQRMWVADDLRRHLALVVHPLVSPELTVE
ncbi:MAG: type IV toxin-antitoxin system AbiEi family antitoxin domain-containing protein [Ilumatobacter sp.]